jgi:hypothetical protein
MPVVLLLRCATTRSIHLNLIRPYVERQSVALPRPALPW